MVLQVRWKEGEGRDVDFGIIGNENTLEKDAVTLIV